MHKDQERLAANQKNLLENIPDLVLLLKNDGIIEYANPTAELFLKEAKEHLDIKLVMGQVAGIFEALLKAENMAAPIKGKVNGCIFSCQLAPFKGYRGDNLYWLFLKPKGEGAEPPETKHNITHYDTIIGSSDIMVNLQKMVCRISKTDATVLITGESGTGKELIANLLRNKSPRKDKPFLTINCNTISNELLMSDLFGYEKGAFTGAHQMKKGKFETADGGTIFLDEIGDINPRMQAALLRVLQYGEVIRVGGNVPIKIDVRIVAATNCNLAAAVRDGTFRLDLYYRLNVINVKVPPLRERKEDLPELTEYFVKKYCKIYSSNICCDDPETLCALDAYDWPGNVRELENVIQRAILMNDTGTFTKEDLMFDMPFEEQQYDKLSPHAGLLNEGPLKGILDNVEKEIITNKLSKNNGNVAETAELLNISKATLYEKMKRHDITAKSLR